MKYVLNKLLILKNNIVFTPLILCMAFIIILSNCFYADFHYPDLFAYLKYFTPYSISEARSISNTLLSSMITLTTVSLSITMLVLSFTSSQIGLRLVTYFLSDRKTKCYIGYLFATIISCFLLTLSLNVQTQPEAIPRLTFCIVFLLCICSIFVLLSFINHVIQSCSVNNIIRKIVAQFRAFVKTLPDNNQASGDNNKNFTKKIRENEQSIPIFQCGYVQHINYQKLLFLASKHNIFFHLALYPGQFIISGEKKIFIYSLNDLENITEKVKRDIIKQVQIARERTPAQDAMYYVRHLVEIAIRSLSPGINDSFTAIGVIEYLAEIIIYFFQKNISQKNLYDNENTLRITKIHISEKEIISKSFNDIRIHAKTMLNVNLCLHNILTSLASLAPSEEYKIAIESQNQMVLNTIKHLSSSN